MGGTADALRAELGGLLGAEHVLDAPPGSLYNFDASRRRAVEGRADAVVLPGSAEEVAALLRWWYAHDVPIVRRGGARALRAARWPRRGESWSRWSACGRCARCSQSSGAWRSRPE